MSREVGVNEPIDTAVVRLPGSGTCRAYQPVFHAIVRVGVLILVAGILLFEVITLRAVTAAVDDALSAGVHVARQYPAGESITRGSVVALTPDGSLLQGLGLDVAPYPQSAIPDLCSPTKRTCVWHCSPDDSTITLVSLLSSSSLALTKYHFSGSVQVNTTQVHFDPIVDLDDGATTAPELVSAAASANQFIAVLQSSASGALFAVLSDFDSTSFVILLSEENSHAPKNTTGEVMIVASHSLAIVLIPCNNGCCATAISTVSRAIVNTLFLDGACPLGHVAAVQHGPFFFLPNNPLVIIALSSASGLSLYQRIPLPIPTIGVTIVLEQVPVIHPAVQVVVVASYGNTIRSFHVFAAAAVDSSSASTEDGGDSSSHAVDRPFVVLSGAMHSLSTAASAAVVERAVFLPHLGEVFVAARVSSGVHFLFRTSVLLRTSSVMLPMEIFVPRHLSFLFYDAAAGSLVAIGGFADQLMAYEVRWRGGTAIAGIAKNSASAGTQCDVIIHGVSNGHEGLIPGVLYTVGVEGAAAPFSGFEAGGSSCLIVGRAISPTEIEVDIPARR